MSETGVKGTPISPRCCASYLDAVYMATPTELHPEHVAPVFAAKSTCWPKSRWRSASSRRGDARRPSVPAWRCKSVIRIAMTCRSRRMREIVTSGALGRVRMIHTWNFTDWIYRPRRPDEFDISQGGGVTFRQGSHQFDIMRLIGGGLVKSVQAITFDWDEAVARSAHIRCSCGSSTVWPRLRSTTATATFHQRIDRRRRRSGDSLSRWTSARRCGARPERGRNWRPSASAPAAQSLRTHRISRIRIYAGECERGDIRQSPDGLLVYSEKGREAIALPNDKSPRDLVLAQIRRRHRRQGASPTPAVGASPISKSARRR